VGTRFQGFVVKTRKANQHSNRRVKYWAKVSSTKTKPKKANQASKSSKSSTRKKVPKRRKLKGGDTPQVHAVLEDLRSGGAGLIEKSTCESYTAKQIEEYGRQAKRIPDDAKLIERLKREETKYCRLSSKVYHPENLAVQNALAIIMANVRLASAPSPESRPYKIKAVARGRDLAEHYYFYYHPNDNVHDLVQSQTPVFIRYVRDHDYVERLSNAKFGTSHTLLHLQGHVDLNDDDELADYRSY
jgi:hypothetical protein